MIKIVVIAKLVPDLVEELEINGNGTALDTTWLRWIINEFDDQALEQALLIKEKVDARITVLMPDTEGVEDVLFTAWAKGVDQLIKLNGDLSDSNNHALSKAISSVLAPMEPDLILTGVQANNDRDGSIGPLLAEHLRFPYLGYVAGMDVNMDRAAVKKEFPGGLVAEMEIQLPAVIGIQAAERPPRYVAVSKVRLAMKEAVIQEQETALLDPSGGLPTHRMFLPELDRRVEMLAGDEREVAERLIELFDEWGVGVAEEKRT